MTPRTSTRSIVLAGAALILALAPAAAKAETLSTQGLANGLQLTLGSTQTPAESLGDLTLAAHRSYSGEGAFKLGGSLGLELADGLTGFAMRFQLVYTAAEIAPRLYLEIPGHFGITLGDNTQIYEFVPALRLRYAVNEKVSVYGDGGLGLAIWHYSAPYGYFSDTTTSAILRWAGGFQVNLNPAVALAVEPLGLNVYFNGNGNTFAYSLLFGFLFRV